MHKYQGESIEDFIALTSKLSDDKFPKDEKLALIKQRVAIVQENLDRDPSGEADFQPFLEALEPSFDTLLPLYKYVNALEKAAKGIDDPALHVKHADSGTTRHISESSRYVAAMKRDHTGGLNIAPIIICLTWRAMNHQDATSSPSFGFVFLTVNSILNAN